MDFDIDVSGEDLLSRDYTICIANHDGLIKGYKIPQEFISIINSRYGQGIYRYHKSKKGKALLKVRIYSVIIYHLFKSIKINSPLVLNICRDFDGREAEIKTNLEYFLGMLLNLKVEIKFGKLGHESNAHKYAYLMKKDTRNKLATYVKIQFDEIERFLKK